LQTLSSIDFAGIGVAARVEFGDVQEVELACIASIRFPAKRLVALAADVETEKR
jgi:hypothetical protein